MAMMMTAMIEIMITVTEMIKMMTTMITNLNALVFKASYVKQSWSEIDHQGRTLNVIMIVIIIIVNIIVIVIDVVIIIGIVVIITE